MLGRTNRLRLERDYRRVYRAGSRRFSHHFCLTVVKSVAPEAAIRIGIVISKKISKKAVDRNLLKRQISAVIQEFLKNEPVSAPFDAIISPKSDAKGLAFTEVRQEIFSLLRLALQPSQRKVSSHERQRPAKSR